MAALRQSWKRVLGLSSRAVFVTVQRMLDVCSIHFCFAEADKTDRNCDGSVLTAGLALTSVLMALTMRKHWSGLRSHNPHGTVVAVVTSALQIAPIVEMLDKVVSQGTPYGFSGAAARQREPLLQNTPPKGSPGENAMRGVRKLSMVNLPQAMLSLWFHVGQLVPVNGHLTAPQHPVILVAAFIASFFSLSFGIADFVLYVWVDDAFVRENKKLVTAHYCVEILARLPMLVLFHMTSKQKYGYAAIALLFLGDSLTTTVMLLAARFSRRVRCCCLPSFCGRHSLTQFLFSLTVSVPLFFVNIVFCDPGMIFFYVNQVYYIVKYCEFVVMWKMIGILRVRSHHHHTSKSWGVSILNLPASWYDAFFYLNLSFVVLNASFVWYWVPRQRHKKDQRLTNMVSSRDSWLHLSADPVEEVATSFPSTLGGNVAVIVPRADAGQSSLLEHLAGTFELLFLLSKATNAGNRSQLQQLVVSNLWHQALPWQGFYDDGSGGEVKIDVDLNAHVVSLLHTAGSEGSMRAWSRKPSGPRGGAQCSIGAGVLVVHEANQLTHRGCFDGRCIYWDDGAVFQKKGDALLEDDLHGEVDASALKTNAILELIWPQLALALRWDKVVLQNADVEAAGGQARPLSGPILDFMMGYAIATRQADFISDLYWRLVCLSEEEEASSGLACDMGYKRSRLALLHTVRGELAPPACARKEGLEDFFRAVRRLLQGQQEVWRQNMELILKHSGRASGGGSWSHKTEALRSALRRWPELRRESRASHIPGVDEQLLKSPHGERAAEFEPEPHSNFVRSKSLQSVDLVSPDEESTISLPIDPTVEFRGIVIDESEVIPSKQAPLLLTCRTFRGKRLLGSQEQQAARKGGHAVTDDVMQEKYLLKVGDDLRQDQLMLQMMALMSCVWQERLPPRDAGLLQIANFRALAVTPQAGYVKFVADSVPLSEALHQSRGNLAYWLEQNHLEGLPLDDVMDNLCGSVAACCVVTYVLGIGDRHLENLCITRKGQLFHVDFGFILGDDPKPMAPPIRLPQQVAQALLATDRLTHCFNLAGRAYLELRPFAGLWSSILQLIAACGGAGCPKLAREPLAAISGLRERLRVDLQDEVRAANEFLCLMRESSEGLASIIIDKVHAAGLFWR